MSNKILNKTRKVGYIGIEVVIIAAIIMGAGFAALSGALKNYDQVGNFINNNLGNNIQEGSATGINIVQDNVTMGIGDDASIILHWTYTPYPSLPTTEPSSIT